MTLAIQIKPMVLVDKYIIETRHTIYISRTNSSTDASSSRNATRTALRTGMHNEFPVLTSRDSYLVECTRVLAAPRANGCVQY